MNRQGQPALFYLHPYELDTEELRQPVAGERWKTRFVRLSQRLNRGKTEAKLRWLLADFEWTSVRAWLAEQQQRGRSDRSKAHALRGLRGRQASTSRRPTRA